MVPILRFMSLPSLIPDGTHTNLMALAYSMKLLYPSEMVILFGFMDHFHVVNILT